MNSPIAHRIANYHYASPDHLRRRRVKTDNFIIGYATAYNAFGLIGSECNGIFVLNESRKTVVLDEHMRADTGYFGPTQAHLRELDRLEHLPDQEFVDFVCAHPRTRLESLSETR